MAQRDTTKSKRTFLTPSEAARRANIGRSTLYRAMQDGTISVSKDANGRKRIDLLERENALLERELADAKNEKGRLLSMLEQKALAGPGTRASPWARLFGARK